MSQAQNIFFNILGGYPPGEGVQSGPPSKILLDYENIGLNHCSCQKSASCLNPLPQPYFWWGVTPPWGVQGGPPSKILSDYENIGINLCPCQKSASYLKKCGRAPPSTFFGGVSRVVLGEYKMEG